MEQELLRYLLAAFPTSSPESSLLTGADDEYLVIHGYRVPFESPVDDVMLGILTEFRRSGFSAEGRRVHAPYAEAGQTNSGRRPP